MNATKPHSWLANITSSDDLVRLDSKPIPEPTLIQRYVAIWRNKATMNFNSLAPGRPWCHFKTAIFNLVLLIGIFTLSKDNALRWMSWDITDDKSTLVQVMAWCHQAASNYMSQCWPSSMSPYGVTRPQLILMARVCYNSAPVTMALHIAISLLWSHLYFLVSTKT